MGVSYIYGSKTLTCVCREDGRTFWTVHIIFFYTDPKILEYICWDIPTHPLLIWPLDTPLASLLTALIAHRAHKVMSLSIFLSKLFGHPQLNAMITQNI